MKKDLDAAAQARAELGEPYLSLIDDMKVATAELHAALDS